MACVAESGVGGSEAGPMSENTIFPLLTAKLSAGIGPTKTSQPAPARKTQIPKKGNKRLNSLKEFLNQELTRSYLLELEEERFAARREKVYTFIRIPRELERLMGYGFFHCADAFLYIFTFLPLRCILAFYHCFLKIMNNMLKFQLTLGDIKGSMKPADKCDLLKFLILFTCVYLFSYIDTSVMYHVIKSQSVIKLYIFFNMLEVGDRLFASFVQDTLDALFLTAVEKTDKKGHLSLTTHTLLAIFSVLGHALVLLFQGTTLSVAINANNRALLTVMMSNNFVELKGAVFKKFDKLNLFQVSCSDVRERFHLCVLLLIVSIQTMREYSWEVSRFWILCPDCIMVIIAEVGVDWIKHAFITRFNELSPDVYKEFTLSLAYDLASSKQKRAISDHSDMVGRRLGFVPLPLAVVLARTIGPSFPELSPSIIILLALGYAALSLFRLLNSIILIGKACDLIQNHNNSQQAGTPVTKGGQLSVPGMVHPHSDIVHSTNQVETNPTEENNAGFARFRNISSQPTTRSPSPRELSPTQLNFTSSNDEIFPLEDDKGDANLVPNTNNRKTQPRRSDGKPMYRSFSASHTPRSSVGGIPESELSSLGEGPDLPDSSAGLLMANSAVSILSVNLNEEMLRATAAAEAGKDLPPAPIISDGTTRERHNSRRYSLGSNVENEFVRMSETDFTECEPSLEALKPAHKNSQENLFERPKINDKFSMPNDRDGDTQNGDLDSTLVPMPTAIGKVQHNLSLNKENENVDEKEAKGETSVKSRKKKGIVSWFSDLTH